MPERNKESSKVKSNTTPILIGLAVVGLAGVAFLWYRSKHNASATPNTNAGSTIPATNIPTIELVPATTQSYGPVGSSQSDWYNYQLGSDSAINGLLTVLNQIAAESGANTPSGQTSTSSSVTSTYSGSSYPPGGGTYQSGSYLPGGGTYQSAPTYYSAPTTSSTTSTTPPPAKILGGAGSPGYFHGTAIAR